MGNGKLLGKPDEMLKKPCHGLPSHPGGRSHAPSCIIQGKLG